MTRGKKITLISSYIVGFLAIFSLIGGHVNYTNWAFGKFNTKFADPMITQHLYSTLMLIGLVVAAVAVIHYALTRKPK